MCLVYGAWLGLSSRGIRQASNAHRTASSEVFLSALSRCSAQESAQVEGIRNLFVRRSKHFPSVHRWLQSAAKGPDISRTLWFTRFLASFSTERFASEDMTASQANVSSTMLGGIRKWVTDAIKHAIFREFNVLVATKESKT